MSKNFIEGLPRFIGHDILVFDARDNPHRTTAAAANLDLDTEHTF